MKWSLKVLAPLFMRKFSIKLQSVVLKPRDQVSKVILYSIQVNVAVPGSESKAAGDHGEREKSQISAYHHACFGSTMPTWCIV